MTLDFAYTLYLILKNGNFVQKTEVKRYVQKWFVLSTLTGRYTNSPESQMDRDLRAIDSKGFLNFLEETEAAMLSDNFWNVGLPQNLETTSVNSPYFNVYLAAQNFFGDHSFLSESIKVEELIKNIGDIHHIFPKQYLIDNGFDNKAVYNQVANYTYLDKSVNISVGKKSPNDYLTQFLEKFKNDSEETEFLKNLEENCVPVEILNMTVDDYPNFLRQRRLLMAQKIKNYYFKL